MSYYDAHDGMTIKQISDLWKIGDKAYDHSMPIWINLNDAWKYRDYTWTKETSRIGFALPFSTNNKQTELTGSEKWDKMYEYMKNHGWDKNQPLIIKLSKTGKANIAEGNHRLAIAKSLNLQKVPATFIFYQDSYRTSDQSYPPRTVENISFRDYFLS